jgi:flagellar motor switch protein FliN/FliY
MSDKNEAVAVRANAILREFAPIFDIPLNVSIEVGRMRVRVRELIKLSPESVIELKKPAGEPFDICINGVPVARGEVIAVEQSSGVRVVEINKPSGMGL